MPAAACVERPTQNRHEISRRQGTCAMRASRAAEHDRLPGRQAQREGAGEAADERSRHQKRQPLYGKCLWQRRNPSSIERLRPPYIYIGAASPKCKAGLHCACPATRPRHEATTKKGTPRRNGGCVPSFYRRPDGSPSVTGSTRRRLWLACRSRTNHPRSASNSPLWHRCNRPHQLRAPRT